MLLATIFFGFSDISAKVSSFLSSRNIFFNKFSISAGGNRLSVYLKQYSFIWTFFVLAEIQFLKNNLIPASEKLIFCLVETISFQFMKYFFYWKQFFHLLEIYFKPILYYGHWQQIFCLIGTILFHSYFL